MSEASEDREMIAAAIKAAERRGIERAAVIAEERFTVDRVHKTKKGRPYTSGQAAIYAAATIAADIRALLTDE